MAAVTAPTFSPHSSFPTTDHPFSRKKETAYNAYERVLKRSVENTGELDIDAHCFEWFLERYEPIREEEGYLVTFF